MLARDGLTDARFESDGEPATRAEGIRQLAEGVRFEAVSGPLIRACAKANASPTNSEPALFATAAENGAGEGEELEIYRAGAT